MEENAQKRVQDLVRERQETLTLAGAVAVNGFVGDAPGRAAIREIGMARMGDDSRGSVLNRWDQAHDVPNLFVTDGAAMTSVSCVNSSLTFMALTARAVDYAVKQLHAGRI